MPLGKDRRDLAVEKILAHLLGLTQQRITESAGTSLFVNDEGTARHRGGNLARQRVALVADLNEIP